MRRRRRAQETCTGETGRRRRGAQERRAQETCTGETGRRRRRAQETQDTGDMHRRNGVQETHAQETRGTGDSEGRRCVHRRFRTPVELRLGCAILGFITEPHRQTNRKWEIQFTFSAESEGRELN